MHFNSDGTGQGKLSVTAPITVGPEGSLELANYDAEPVHLSSIRSVNPSTKTIDRRRHVVSHAHMPWPPLAA